MDNLIVPLNPQQAELRALVEKMRALQANTVSAATKRGYAADFFGGWKPWAESHKAPVLRAEPERSASTWQIVPRH